MRIVRIDQIAPGGAPLELHPQLTLVRAPGPELRRRLESTVRALGGAATLVESGVIEVSGVQLALDVETLGRLRLEPPVDPVVRLATPPVAPASQLPAPVVVVSSDEAALRDQLRAVTTTRTELAERMDRARSGLDSFSTAALEVCLGQIDALESRRATLRVDWERERGERDAVVASASGQLAALHSTVARLAELTSRSDRVAQAIERRELAVADAVAPDPLALQLAAQLDAAAARTRELAEALDRDRAVAAQLRDALAAEQSRAAQVERAVGGGRVDPAAVQRLETVRDEIFAVDARQSVLGAARNKRRVAELRSEEAILLDRLGFDTYSAYVMGIPSVRAEMARGAELSAARERVAAIESRLAEVDASSADTSGLTDAAAQLARLLDESLHLLGEPSSSFTADELAAGVVDGGTPAELVQRVGRSLRARTVVDPTVLERASTELRSTLEDLERVVTHDADDPTSGPVAVQRPPDPPGTAQDLDALAGDWSGWFEAAEEWIRRSAAWVAELERLVGDVDDGPDADRIGRWAQVEAELDEALDRMAEAQERVRRHEAATAELATLRSEELALRDQERELLERIAAAGATAAASPPIPPPLPATHHVLSDTDPTALEWELIARLSRQRSLSFVGSVPVLIDGVPADAPARQRVLDRLGRLSDLLQVIVIADDEASLAWAGDLATRGLARCI